MRTIVLSIALVLCVCMEKVYSGEEILWIKEKPKIEAKKDALEERGRDFIEKAPGKGTKQKTKKPSAVKNYRSILFGRKKKDVTEPESRPRKREAEVVAEPDAKHSFSWFPWGKKKE